MINSGVPELLAPAGGFEALRAAVENGADAVYLGGERFNARRMAGNFPDAELKAALEFAKERGVKVYITLNTLVKDDEMDEALQFAGFVYEEGADALIVQDIGLAGLLHACFPDMKLHASTQMTVMNSCGVRACEEMGIRRVVPARELSLEEIKALVQSSGAEIEIFIHGALCVCYSGQCLLSSYIGARSGNRGACAQPCRLPWRLSADGAKWTGESYLMSTRDLMGLALLPAIGRAGVASLKIEGRMKSPEYVATVTRIYRKYLDRLSQAGEQEYRVDGEDLERLLQIFNRGGFTSSYLEGSRDYTKLIYPKHPKNRGVKLGHVAESRNDAVKVLLEKPISMGDGIEVWDAAKGTPDIIVSSILLKGEHTRYAPVGTMPWVGDMKTVVEKGSEVWRTYSRPLMEEARASFEGGETRRIPLKATFTVQIGNPVVLTLTDAEGVSVTACTRVSAEKAETRPLSQERVAEQLRKTGDTVYSIDSVTVETDGLSTIPISALNALRRQALDSIKSERISRGKRKPAGRISYAAALSEKKPINYQSSLTAFFYEVPNLPPEYHAKVGRIYVPVLDPEEAVELRKSFGGEIFIWTPNIVKDREIPPLMKDIHALEGCFDGISAANAGILAGLAGEFPGKKLHADTPLNIFNSAAFTRLEQWGASSAAVSPELNGDEAGRLDSGALQPEITVYGRVPLMTLEYCPSGASAGCAGKCGACSRNRGFLQDRKGFVFPFVRNPRFNVTYLFSPGPLFTDRIGHVPSIRPALFRLSFFDEDVRTIQTVTDWYRRKTNTSETAASAVEYKKIEAIREKSEGDRWRKGV